MSTFIYDADCGFCTRTVDVLRRRVTTAVEYASQYDYDLPAAGIDATRVTREAVLVAGDSVYGGAQAIAQLFMRANGAWPIVGRLMSVRPVSGLAALIYRLVATNRTRLPGGTDACAVPLRDLGDMSRILLLLFCVM